MGRALAWFAVCASLGAAQIVDSPVSWFSVGDRQRLQPCDSGLASPGEYSPIGVVAAPVIEPGWQNDHLVVLGLVDLKAYARKDFRRAFRGDVMYSVTLGSDFQCARPTINRANATYDMNSTDPGADFRRIGAAYVGLQVGLGCSLSCVIGGAILNDTAGADPPFKRTPDVLCAEDNTNWRYHAPLPWSVTSATVVSFRGALWVIGGQRTLIREGAPVADASMYVAAVDKRTCTITGWVNRADAGIMGFRQGMSAVTGFDPVSGRPSLYLAGGLVSTGGIQWFPTWDLWMINQDTEGVLHLDWITDSLPLAPLHWGNVPLEWRTSLYSLLPGPGASTAEGTLMTKFTFLWQAGSNLWFSNDGGRSFQPFSVRTWPAPTQSLEHAPIIMMHATPVTASDGTDYVLAFRYPLLNATRPAGMAAVQVGAGGQASLTTGPTPRGAVGANQGLSRPVIGPTASNGTTGGISGRTGPVAPFGPSGGSGGVIDPWDAGVARASVAGCHDPCSSDSVIDQSGIDMADMYSTGCVQTPSDAKCKLCSACGLGSRELVACGTGADAEQSDRVCEPETVAFLLSVNKPAAGFMWALAGLAPAAAFLLWCGAIQRLDCRRCKSSGTGRPAVEWSPAGKAKPGAEAKPPQDDRTPLQRMGLVKGLALILAGTLCASAVSLEVALAVVMALFSSVEADELAPSGTQVLSVADPAAAAAFSRLVDAARKLPILVGSALLVITAVQPLVCSIALPSHHQEGSNNGAAGVVEDKPKAVQAMPGHASTVSSSTSTATAAPVTVSNDGPRAPADGPAGPLVQHIHRRLFRAPKASVGDMLCSLNPRLLLLWSWIKGSALPPATACRLSGVAILAHDVPVVLVLATPLMLGAANSSLHEATMMVMGVTLGCAALSGLLLAWHRCPWVVACVTGQAQPAPYALPATSASAGPGALTGTVVTNPVAGGLDDGTTAVTNALHSARAGRAAIMTGPPVAMPLGQDNAVHSNAVLGHSKLMYAYAGPGGHPYAGAHVPGPSTGPQAVQGPVFVPTDGHEAAVARGPRVADTPAGMPQGTQSPHTFMQTSYVVVRHSGMNGPAGETHGQAGRQPMSSQDLSSTTSSSSSSTESTGSSQEHYGRQGYAVPYVMAPMDPHGRGTVPPGPAQPPQVVATPAGPAMGQKVPTYHHDLPVYGGSQLRTVAMAQNPGVTMAQNPFQQLYLAQSGRQAVRPPPMPSPAQHNNVPDGQEQSAAPQARTVVPEVAVDNSQQ